MRAQRQRWREFVNLLGLEYSIVAPDLSEAKQRTSNQTEPPLDGKDSET